MAKAKNNFNNNDTPTSKFAAHLSEVIDALPNRLKTSPQKKSIVIIPLEKFEPKATGQALFAFKKELHEKFDRVDFTFEPIESIYGLFVMLTINPDTEHTFDVLDKNNLPHNTWVEHFHNLQQALGFDGFGEFMKQRQEDGTRAIGYTLYIGQKGVDMNDLPLYWDVNPNWPKPKLLPEHKRPTPPWEKKNNKPK